MLKMSCFSGHGLLFGLLALAIMSPWPAVAEASNVGDVAPDFAVTTLDGTSFGLAERQGRVVVLMFTAPGCGGCIPELQALAQVHAEYAQRGVDILVLNVDPYTRAEDLLDFKDFVGGGDHAWAQDEGNVVTLAYGVRALETTVIVGRDGRVAYRDERTTSLDMYRAALTPLL